MINWKKGSGSLVLGVYMLLLCGIMSIFLVQTFLRHQKLVDSQNAADAIADGTAFFMSSNGGDYHDAQNKANLIAKRINRYIGMDIDEVEIEEDAIEDNIIRTDIRVNARPVGSRSKEALYKIRSHAATEYSGYGYGDDYIEWMLNVAADNTHGYNMDNRGFNPDVDCSSFVYYALKETGYHVNAGGWSTSSMAGVLKGMGFEEISIAEQHITVKDLRPGDIFLRYAGFRGHQYGHTEVVTEADGTGRPYKRVGAHSNYDGKTGDGSGNEVSEDTFGSIGDYQYIYRPTANVQH